MAITRNSLLTGRERDVLALAGRGLTNQEIADELFISTRTVKCTLHRACVRLGAHNRTQAVISAISQGALHILEMFSADELAELLAFLPPETIANVCQRALQHNAGNRLPSNTTGYERGGQGKKQMRGEVKCAS
jgi:DNA-binding CsgD family transcriptional regulator